MAEALRPKRGDPATCGPARSCGNARAKIDNAVADEEAENAGGGSGGVAEMVECTGGADAAEDAEFAGGGSGGDSVATARTGREVRGPRGDSLSVRADCGTAAPPAP